MARRCSRAFYVEACFRKFFVIIFKEKSHYIWNFTKFGLNLAFKLNPEVCAGVFPLPKTSY